MAVEDLAAHLLEFLADSLPKLTGAELRIDKFFYKRSFDLAVLIRHEL